MKFVKRPKKESHKYLGSIIAGSPNIVFEKKEIDGELVMIYETNDKELIERIEAHEKSAALAANAARKKQLEKKTERYKNKRNEKRKVEPLVCKYDRV